ncbi:MAG: histidine kinase [Ancalomicrobiaceae bacterium]|nr:histidine kinase [Ancalomicrobiaceae bacterium]
MPDIPTPQVPRNHRVVGIYDIYVIYTVLVYVMGTIVRFGLNKDLLLATAQTVLFDSWFLLILFFLTFLIKKSDITVSLVTTIVIILGSTILGSLYSIAVIKPLMLPVLSHILPSSTIPLYPPASVALYYTMIAVIWTLTLVWMMNIQKSARNEIAAINARNESEKRAILVELRRLREQLDPHLVFNSLNMVIAEINEDPRLAAAMLRELSAVLRYSLDMGEQEFASVAEEVGAIGSFIRVQRMRYGAGLDCKVELEQEAGHHLIPTLLVQPLIENALKHGLPDASGVLRARVKIRAEGDTLTIEVRNSGRLAPGEKGGSGTKIGLNNLRSRLQLHYGDRAAFEFNQVGDVVIATLRLVGDPQ